LWSYPVRVAQQLRWERGMVARGRKPSDPFQGNAMEELYEELIDGLNYLDQLAHPAGKEPLVLPGVKSVLHSLLTSAMEVRGWLLDRAEGWVVVADESE
jgi:hypothetical protein